jgi:methylmalonyl-CoA mutase N-terminal domain/subunit
VTQTVDPLAGSWFVESLTDELEKRTFAYLEEIERQGGTIRCIETGYIQNEISASAYADQRAIDEGRIQVVGVNTLQGVPGESQDAPVELLRIPPELEREAVERIRAYRAKRSEATVTAALKAVQEGVKSGENLMALILIAAKAGGTLGEIADAMRGEFGLYREYAGF